MSNIYNIPDYWDFATPENQIPLPDGAPQYTQTWYTASGVVSFVSQQQWVNEYGGVTKADTYSSQYSSNGSLIWHDSWYYKNDPERGILEIADDMPKTGAAKLLFWTDKVREAYLPGKEIHWGAKEKADGTAKTWPIQIDYSNSIVMPFFQGPWSYGQQICIYTHLDTFKDNLGRIHEDVIVIQCSQPWGGNLANTEARYYCKKGVGRVAVEWLTYDNTGAIVSTSAMVAAVYTGSINLPA